MICLALDSRFGQRAALVTQRDVFAEAQDNVLVLDGSRYVRYVTRRITKGLTGIRDWAFRREKAKFQRRNRGKHCHGPVPYIRTSTRRKIRAE